MQKLRGGLHADYDRPGRQRADVCVTATGQAGTIATIYARSLQIIEKHHRHYVRKSATWHSLDAGRCSFLAAALTRPTATEIFPLDSWHPNCLGVGTLSLRGARAGLNHHQVIISDSHSKQTDSQTGSLIPVAAILGLFPNEKYRVK